MTQRTKNPFIAAPPILPPAREVSRSYFDSEEAVQGGIAYEEYQRAHFRKMQYEYVQARLRQQSIAKLNAEHRRQMERDARPPSTFFRGLCFAFGIMAMLVGGGTLSLAAPLWAVPVITTLLVIGVYLAHLTHEVLSETIPASEVQQRTLDWIMGPELPPLPPPSTCDDCGRLREDCSCAKNCDNSIVTLGDPEQRCVMCGTVH